jgi:hypothetical protein
MGSTWGSCRWQQPQAVRRNRVAVFMRLQRFVGRRLLGVSRVAVLGLVSHSIRYSLVRFNRDAVVSDSQGLPRHAATPGSKPADVRTPAGFRPHVATTPHATARRALRHPCQVQIIAHALVEWSWLRVRILPKGFTKSRCCGGYSNHHCKRYLTECRALLSVSETPADRMSIEPEDNLPVEHSCPKCESLMVAKVMTDQQRGVTIT